MFEDSYFDSLRQRMNAPVDTATLHRFLLDIQTDMGRVPSEICGPGVWIRWRFVNSYGSDCFLMIHPKSLPGEGWELNWQVEVLICEVKTALSEDYNLTRQAIMAEMNAMSADAGKTHHLPPYLWNFRLRDCGELDEPIWGQLVSWAVLVRALGEMLGRLPDDLAALPPSWFDGSLTLVNEGPEPFWVSASRHGLKAWVSDSDSRSQNRLGGEVGTSLVMIPAERASQAGPLLARSFAANFEPGHRLEHIRLNTVAPPEVDLTIFGTGVWFSDESSDQRFRTMNAQLLAATPDYPNESQAIRQLATWVNSPPKAMTVDEAANSFPEWKPGHNTGR